MVQRMSPGKIKTITQDGECDVNITFDDIHIVLDLNISINQGEIAVAAQATKKTNEPKFQPEIPQFSSGKPLPNFGKEIK